MCPDFVDAAYCINLARRPERWQGFQATLAACAWPFVPVQRYDAVDGQTAVLPPGIVHAGPWGCLQSHLGIWRQAMVAGGRAVLVLEDDVYFADNFGSKAAEFLALVPGDWDMLYLGGRLHRARITNTSLPGVLRVIHVMGLYAYVIRTSFLRRLIPYVETILAAKQEPTWSKNKLWHIDRIVGRYQLQGGHVYTPTRWLVGHQAGVSDNTGKMEPRLSLALR